MRHIHLKPLTWVEKLLDLFLLPVMYVLSGTIKESPQQTHRWNYARLDSVQLSHLREHEMVFCSGVPKAPKKKYLFGLIPLFYTYWWGWRDYIVLAPSDHSITSWYAGWITKDGSAGISRLPIQNRVRHLVGHGDVHFFGVNREGCQIPLERVGSGRIRNGGEFTHDPLH